MNLKFPNIRVILLETSHPGNIGAAARAMKTMGLSQLVLVSPRFFPHLEAQARARGAVDILETARVVSTLEEGLKDCGCIIGMSAQSRHLPWPQLSPRECGIFAVEQSQRQTLALLFGREREGLHNEELQQCHYHVEIPSNPACRALNLAAALQVIAYEIRVAGIANERPIASIPQEWATSEQIEALLQHVYTAAQEVGFLKTDQPKLLKERLRRIVIKAQLDTSEANMLHGFLKKAFCALKNAIQSQAD